ncbi:hypothetical protein ASPTUDRAFT_393176 [Aspergillus tubingensis CBS 134.48]|uniref:Uncharacterized protein n=1 Tax=Aspergillus tubingensis (strain CBS 134.48) TaxID=767770 RepID=A0A1L9NFK8_ASPTC|nr:hypothetical protein ASPTUDRAFT_393176 [Aspergillus tubingensis CBS 134.48]
MAAAISPLPSVNLDCVQSCPYMHATGTGLSFTFLSLYSPSWFKRKYNRPAISPCRSEFVS